MKKQFFILLTILFFFVACKKEYELKKSVFINDSENVGLPIYSEWGYNTFGAYYDRGIFVSNNVLVPGKVIVSDSTMSFVLSGEIGEYDYRYGRQDQMSMTFTISGLALGQYTDLLVLNDTSFNLKNPLCQVLISTDTEKYAVNILSGEIKFKRAQKLLVDKEQVEVILSGYFDFKAIINDSPVTISNGRFDVGISSDNFYNN